jgi:replicative superfamily II helicase
MVDFRKKLGSTSTGQPLDPLDIYERLDRESDKGPLRPAQEDVLRPWHTTRRAEKDVIVKLHTGQGKTLIGLLILQSKLNEKMGPALYLCPDNFLVDQTARQAKQFGFEVCTAAAREELPAAFLESKSILVTSVQKLFNGLTKFGLLAKSLPVGAIVIDDVHASIDAIRDACTIRLNSKSPAYSALVDLFGPALEGQGQGTYADIVNGEYDALLPIPYWDWIDHTSEVAKILSQYAASNEIKFAWPLIKDMLPDCDCLVSGTELEFFPRLPPLSDFGSYHRAGHRIFMSATVSDDSFLIKGMGLSDRTIQSPLTYPGEKWSGEKMVLIPSLLSETLDRSALVERFAKPVKDRKYGVVVLVPSFKGAADWKSYGAAIAEKDTIESEVARLRRKHWDVTLVVANRYDGIDLPDNACRVLIMDSRPRGAPLFDRHQEKCLADTEVLAAKTARSIEQGMGRSVRGEKDYSVILLIGPDLVGAVRSSDARKFLSSQTQKQVEIGLAIAEFAKEDIQRGEKPPDRDGG